MFRRIILKLTLMFLFYSCSSESGTNVPLDDVVGCMQVTACNYDSEATTEGLGNSSPCWYANEGCDCSDGDGSIIDCNNECGGSANYDSCGICSGGNTGIVPGSSCGIIEDGCNLPLNTIGFVPKLGDDIYGKIIYNINSDNIVGIAGFQFDINNANMIFNETGSFNPNIPFAGGDATLEGLTIQANSSSSTILGVSFTGNVIQVSNNQLCGELINIAYENDFSSNSDEVFFTNIVFSDTSGSSIPVQFEDTCTNGEYDCYGTCEGSAYIDLCLDCVEGLSALEDCADGYMDCYGNVGIDADPNVVIDCNNVCGGTAVYDECGICGGSGPLANFDCEGNCILDVDCNGVCGGNSILDCSGVCDGPSVVDDCGICDGDGISCQLSACDIDENTIYLNHLEESSYNVFYNINSDFTAFQFDLLFNSDNNGDTLVDASGGDAASSGLIVSQNTENNRVIAFSFTNSVVTSGCGTLVNLTISGTPLDTLANITFSDINATNINVSYYIE